MTAVALALVAALLFGTGIALQSTALAGRQLSARRWLLGTLLDTLGALAHVAALHLGALPLVQPIALAAIAVAVPVESLLARRRPQGRRLLAAAATAGGLGALATLLGAAPLLAPSAPVAVVAVVALAAVGLPLLLSRRATSPGPQAALLGAAAGACFGVSATLVHAVGRGPFAVAGAAHLLVPGLLAAALGAIGVVLTQVALRRSHLACSLPAQDLTAVVVSIGLGALLLGELPSLDPARLAGVAASTLLVVGGATVLARGPGPGAGTWSIDDPRRTHALLRGSAPGLSAPAGTPPTA